MKNDTCNTICGKKNVGNTERIISVAAGSFFLYKALTGKNNWLNGLLGAALLGRGATGYCGAYDVLNVDTKEEESSDRKSWCC